MRFMWLLLVVVAVVLSESSQVAADSSESEHTSPRPVEDDTDNLDDDDNTDSPVEVVTDIPRGNPEVAITPSVGEVTVEGRTRSKAKANPGNPRLFGHGAGHVGGGFGNFGINHGLGSGVGANPGFGGGLGALGTGLVGIITGLGLGGGFSGASPIVPAPVAPASTCRYWCQTPEGQFYCCENINQPQSFAGIVKPGICPAVRPVCPQVRNFLPPTPCSSDGGCGGNDKCCFDRCLNQHVCKFPSHFG